MRRILTGILILVLSAAGRAGHFAQDTSQFLRDAPAFEVASIKPTTQIGLSGVVPPDRFRRRGITLSLLLVYAFDMALFRIEGGEPWTKTALFEIEAKADGHPTAEQMRTMVKQLLADRFSLRVHMETRDQQRYALVKARKDGQLGPKLSPAAIDCSVNVSAASTRGASDPSPADDRSHCRYMIRVGGGTQKLTLNGHPISQLARSLQVDVGRMVIDRTGLSGTYNLELESETPFIPGAPIPPGGFAPPHEGLSVFTALQEQLGLKLESDRGPVDILVIDRAEVPTPD